jgi:hypothetical protein
MLTWTVIGCSLPLEKVMTKQKTRGDELGAIGKQTMAHAYSAMDYYFDHLKKPSHRHLQAEQISARK